jgi:hypothetical protein
MQYPCLPCSPCPPCNPCPSICTATGSVALLANVQSVVNAIKMRQVIPYGEYGGPNVYYFGIMCNGLGNITYTVFDKCTTLGLASFMVRYGTASTIKQILFEPFPRSQIDLQYLILPHIPVCHPPNGMVVP